jgi:uncharacterized RDD family membrane protein YckC
VPMHTGMNAIAPASAPPRGPQFDNRRVLAGLIDVGIVIVVAAVLGFVTGLAGGDNTAALQAVVLGWALFYYFALESGAGQTVGKQLMGLRVTMADGSHADMRAIAIRTVLRVIDGFAFYLVGLIVMLATGERRQRLGDLAAGTIVTSADKSPAVAPAAPAAVATPAPSGPEAIVLGAAFAPVEPVVSTPELKPFDPFAPVDAEPALEADAPVDAEGTPAAEEAVEQPAAEVASEPSEPVAELSHEPADDVSAEPVVELAEQPVVEVEPVAELAPESSEQAVAEYEPIVDVSQDPVVDDEPLVEIASGPAAESGETPDEPPAPDQAAADDWSFPLTQEAPDAPEPEQREQPAPADEVKVRSVETVSAIDLVMGEVEEDEAAGSAPTA